jgi:hypothetical protein
MKTRIKKQYMLCFLEERQVLTDARLESYGVGYEADETFTFEVAEVFNSKFDALKYLESNGASDQEFTILEKFKVVEVSK